MGKPPLKLMGFFHGIDPATQGDFYVDFVHALFEKPRLYHGDRPDAKIWNPYPIDVLRLQKIDPNRMIDLQVKMFNKYPPMLAKIDQSREDFLTFALQRKYGESKILGVKFLNSGQSNVKFMLKQTGYSYLNAGYEWPKKSELVKRGFVKRAALFAVLKKEMLHELAEYTKTNRITFNHPIGRHNDMVHAWELSLSAVMEFQQKNLGFEKRMGSAPAYNTVIEEIYAERAKQAEEDEPDPVFEKYFGTSGMGKPAP